MQNVIPATIIKNESKIKKNSKPIQNENGTQEMRDNKNILEVDSC